jgi:hypothetical protein
MSDDDIVKALQAKQRRLSAVELADLLDELTGGYLSQATLVSYFKRAFPSIPLRVLIEAGAWTRVSDGGLTDEQFDGLLGPWLTSLEPKH